MEWNRLGLCSIGCVSRSLECSKRNGEFSVST